ncbi:MAG: hypothetical protein ACM30G_05055 [Micromonosporaceae bacterium]
MNSTRRIAVLIGLALGVAQIPILTTTAAANSTCGLPNGVLETHDLSGLSAVACGAVGRFVDAGDGVPLLVQPPGRSVTLGLLSPTGTRTYTLTTDAQGRVTASTQSWDATDTVLGLLPGQGSTNSQGSANGQGSVNGQGINTTGPKADEFPDVPGFPGACERDSYNLAGFKWYGPYLYRTRLGSALANGSPDDFDAAARRAFNNWTHGRNTCDMHGGINATAAQVGHTTLRGNFINENGQTTCGVSDGENVLDTNDLAGGTFEAFLAGYCVWTENHDGLAQATSADLSFNNGDYNWTYHPTTDPLCDPAPPPDPQRWRYDVESTMTHEAGHVFGLVNLAEIEDLNQTMFPGVRRCSGHFRTLGRGDVLGMRALYGPNS